MYSGCFPQDICNELREIIFKEQDKQALTTYHGHQMKYYEVADLMLVSQKHHTITNISFVSTSKNRKIALTKLKTADIHPFDADKMLVLFAINTRKQDRAHYLPFADISQISQHRDEEEVLFAARQIFIIHHFQLLFEIDTEIFSHHISLDCEFEKRFT